MPVPQALPIPPLPPPYHFQVPRKRIKTRQDVDSFLRSEDGAFFLGFVVSLSDAVRGRKLSDACHVSQRLEGVLAALGAMSRWVDDIPPAAAALRYGNPSYRLWHARLQEEGPGLFAALLPDKLQGASTELFPYLADSFGNAVRIDYGTGHEANFVAWLLCLRRLGLVAPEDYPAIAARVVVKYLDLMRKLQMTYWLEPAGSHGVWGLDDYHFLPFILGSSQLVAHKYIRPKSIHNADVLEHYGGEYLYLSCVAFVRRVKKGPLAEHSPMLNDISGVPTWAKVNSGMLKMYRAECLEKVPIMQHFLFGSIIRWPS